MLLLLKFRLQSKPVSWAASSGVLGMLSRLTPSSSLPRVQMRKLRLRKMT